MSLQEGFRRNIKKWTVAGGTAVSVAIAGCAPPPVNTVETELPVKIEFPPCDVDPQSKTIEIMKGVTVVIGGLEITKGNNPEGLEVQATSQEMSPLSIGQTKDGEISIDLKTGRVFQIKGNSIETNCNK